AKEALDAHQKNNFESEKLKKWKDALIQVANLPGWKKLIFSVASLA
ncbi:hypothetical protein A2U01_0104681, partial [Trifolium medium]|nr:hypothetical protein [Trifolium medium]